MLPTDQEYRKLLSEAIQKQIVLLGPSITLAKARSIHGMKISNDGTVTSFSGDRKEISDGLIEKFSELSILIGSKMKAYLDKDMEVKKEEINPPASPSLPEQNKSMVSPAPIPESSLPQTNNININHPNPATISQTIPTMNTGIKEATNDIPTGNSLINQ